MATDVPSYASARRTGNPLPVSVQAQMTKPRQETEVLLLYPKQNNEDQFSEETKKMIKPNQRGLKINRITKI